MQSWVLWLIIAGILGTAELMTAQIKKAGLKSKPKRNREEVETGRPINAAADRDHRPHHREEKTERGDDEELAIHWEDECKSRRRRWQSPPARARPGSCFLKQRDRAITHQSTERGADPDLRNRRPSRDKGAAAQHRSSLRAGPGTRASRMAPPPSLR